MPALVILFDGNQKSASPMDWLYHGQKNVVAFATSVDIIDSAVYSLEFVISEL